MAFTQTDVDALKTAIASRKGVKQMTFADRSYTFDSADDMIKLLAAMERDVAAAASTPTTRFASTSKGFR